MQSLIRTDKTLVASRQRSSALIALGLLGLACRGEISGADPAAAVDDVPLVPSGGPTDEVRSVAETCNATASASAEFAPLARLTRREYVRSVKDLVGVDVPLENLQPDGIVGLFFANVGASVSETQVDDYRETAEQVAEAATQDVSALTGCPNADETCAGSFIQSFGRRAFRRPLRSDEQAAYSEIYRVGIGREGFRGGIRLVVAAMLQSPWFLYRVEQTPRTAAGAVQLNGFEVAARLASLITSSTPDAALLDAAESGALDTEAGVTAQADRLLATTQAGSALGAFHSEWLKVSGVTETEKDLSAFPMWTSELKAAALAETERFVGYVLGQGDGKFSTLLTAPFTVIDPALAPIYGVTVPAGGGRVDLPPPERSGLFTQIGFLAVKAHKQQTSPVRRGLGLLQSLACISLPPPPNAAAAVEPSTVTNATTRERFAAHSANPACAGCHVKIDPPGFIFESYDAVGRYRTSENGVPVDSQVTIVDKDDEIDFEGDYPNVRALLERVAQSQTVTDCYATQWFRYALKREPVLRDACSLKRMLAAFDGSQGKIGDLVRAVATSDAFRFGVKEAE